MTIILDACSMVSRSTAHPYLKEKLNFPDYYGNNLDALYDCLTDLGPTEVYFANKDKGSDFFAKIVRVFKDAHKDNPQLVILEKPPQEEDAACADEAGAAAEGAEEAAPECEEENSESTEEGTETA